MLQRLDVHWQDGPARMHDHAGLTPQTECSVTAAWEAPT
jgi:hypothetical protein